MKNHFGHRVRKYDPSTELARDFCGGIGPLQLGVVLVHSGLKIPISIYDNIPTLIHAYIPLYLCLSLDLSHKTTRVVIF